MKSCDARYEDLKAYVDGELSLLRRLLLHWHLTRCASCRKEIKRMEQISTELRADETDNGLDSALRAKILAGVPEGAPPTPDSAHAAKPTPKWKRRPLMIWGTAAVVVMAWFVIIFPMFVQSREKASQPSQQAGLTQEEKIERGKQAIPADATLPTSGGKAPGGLLGGSRGRTFGALAGKRADSYLQLRDGPLVAGKEGGELRKYAIVQPQRMAKVNIEAPPPPDRKVHKEASITVEVDNPEAKSDEVENFIKEAGGYVANNEVSTGDDQLKTASLTVKVPVQRFESILRKIAKLGNVKAKNVNGEDITEETSDQQQAVRTLSEDIRETQARLQRRQSRSATQADREELRELKIEAAQKAARLELLKKMATMATITVELNEKPKPAPPVKTGGFLDEMKETGHDAIQSFSQAARLPVITLIWLLAYSPVLILLAVTYRYVIRRGA